MTREEAKQAAEVMMAYAEGKEVESSSYSEDNWKVCIDPLFHFETLRYRIKKEPTYRPFKDKEECWNEMQKHQPFGWVKDKKVGYLSTLTIISDDNRFDCLNENYTFADGTPFGIKEE